MKIEYDTDTETVTIDGVRISMHALRQFTQHPNPLALYRIQREGDALTIKELSTSYGVSCEWASIETQQAAKGTMIEIPVAEGHERVWAELIPNSGPLGIAIQRGPLSHA